MKMCIYSKIVGKREAELQGSIIALHKKITEIECPRDDSLDNQVCTTSTA